MLKTEGIAVEEYGLNAENPDFFDSNHVMRRQSSRHTISNMSHQRVVSRANREVDYFNKIGVGRPSVQPDSRPPSQGDYELATYSNARSTDG